MCLRGDETWFPLNSDNLISLRPLPLYQIGWILSKKGKDQQRETHTEHAT